MSFHKDREIKKTRKPHKCFFCGGRIETGSPAVYFSGVYDGEFYDGHFDKTCDEIYKYLNKFYRDGLDEGLEPNSISEWMDGVTDCNAKNNREFLHWLKDKHGNIYK